MQIKSAARVEWIDLCKFIGVFYMVWAHSGVSIALDKYIHTFHMPVFFFLSGYVFKAGNSIKFKDFILKRVKSLLVPYFAFSLITYYSWWLFYKLSNQPVTISIRTLFYSIFTYNTILSPYSGVQWFLTSLFLAELLFFIITKIVKQSETGIGLMLVIFSLAGYFYSSISAFRLYWGLDSAFTGVVFLGIGYLFKNINKPAAENIIQKLKLKSFLALLILGVGSGLINSTVNMRTLKYGNYFLFYISAISSILMYTELSSYICNKELFTGKLYRWFLFIGRNSIVVLMLNQFFIQLIKIIWFHKPVIRLPNINLWGLITSLIVLLIISPIIIAFNRFLPELIGKRRVQRNRTRSKVTA